MKNIKKNCLKFFNSNDNNNNNKNNTKITNVFFIYVCIIIIINYLKHILLYISMFLS